MRLWSVHALVSALLFLFLEGPIKLSQTFGSFIENHRKSEKPASHPSSNFPIGKMGSLFHIFPATQFPDWENGPTFPHIANLPSTGELWVRVINWHQSKYCLIEQMIRNGVIFPFKRIPETVWGILEDLTEGFSRNTCASALKWVTGARKVKGQQSYSSQSGHRSSIYCTFEM